MNDDRPTQREMAQDRMNESDHDKLEKVHEAVFGDGNGDKGMKRKVDDMYELFMGASFGSKLIRNIIGFLASMSIAIYVIWKVAKGQSPF